MKAKTMKLLAGLSLVLMVFTIIPSGALAEETNAYGEEIGNMLEHRMDRESRHRMNKDNIERPEFVEQDFETTKERMQNNVEMRIERLQNMMENIDQIDNEEITEETLNEKIAEMEAHIEQINNATDIDALGEIREAMRENAPEMRSKAGIERPEFETEEEELEFAKERMLNNAEMRIEKLQNAIDNIDQIENEEVTEETLNERISEIEASIEDINSASDLEELKETMEDIRENNPRPDQNGRVFFSHPHHMAQEEVAVE